jgi:hypothetical protein
MEGSKGQTEGGNKQRWTTTKPQLIIVVTLFFNTVISDTKASYVQNSGKQAQKETFVNVKKK